MYYVDKARVRFVLAGESESCPCEGDLLSATYNYMYMHCGELDTSFAALARAERMRVERESAA